MTHSSVVPMIFAGKQTYVYCGSGGVAGVSADDGRILWETTEWKVTMATVPTPVIVGEDRVFLTGGYGAGSMMLQLREAGGKIEPTVLFRLKPEVFGSDQHTPILHEGKIYGVIPGGQLACLDLEGKRLWASGSKARFGLGPYMMADGKFILMNDTGTLTLAEATAEGYRQLAQAKIFQNGHDAWGPFALVNGRLLARDMTRLVCLDLRAETKP
jgi:outer membrane protein assembly factor BamB